MQRAADINDAQNRGGRLRSLRVLTFPTMRRRHPWLFRSLAMPARVVAGLGIWFIAVAPYLALRSIADDDGMPRSQFVLIRADRLIGFGATPTERLQSSLFSGSLSAFDWVLIAAYISFFFLPLAVGAYILVFRPGLFPSFLLVTMLTWYGALPFFALLPAEPPWMALGVTRIIELRQTAPVGIDPNQLAAFPSLHVGLPVAIAAWLWAKRVRWLALPVACLAAVVGFAVVYLGEHYVVDVLAGATLGLCLVRAAGLLEEPLGNAALGLRRHFSPSASAEPGHATETVSGD